MKRSSLATVLLVLLAMVWLAGNGDDCRHWYTYRPQKDDYYNLLADSLRAGRLDLQAEVPAGLLSADPKVRAQTPYLLDTSLYQGRYYLYFGVVPAVLAFLPYLFLTGHHLSPNAAILLMVAAGFLVYVRLYGEAKRRYFAALPPLLDVPCLLLLAFAPVTPVLLTCPGVYEVPIAGGYLGLAVAWWCLYRALHAPGHAGRWLVPASLGLALAVGCRPPYVVALPVLLLAAWLAVRARPEGTPGPWGRTRLLAAAVLPAALVGALLMAYNYERFGNPFEFGLHYQLSELVFSGLPLTKLSFLWPNLRWYYLVPPVIGPYFPYFLPIDATVRPSDYYGYEPVHGQWLTLLLLLVCGAAVARGSMSGRHPPPLLRVFGGMVGGVFAALLLCLALFGFRAERYMVDFQASLILGLVLFGAWAAVHAWSVPGGMRTWRALFGLLAAATAVFCVLSSIGLLDRVANTRPETFGRVAYYGNYPSHLLARCGWLHYGPVRFKVAFTPQHRVVVEPLLATGTSGYTDILCATQFPDGLIDFALIHHGYGGPKSDLLNFTPGSEHELEVDLGSLYPPRWHPFFRGWTQENIEKVKTTARVELDGREILRGRLRFYDAPPGSILLGRNPDGNVPAFSGRIHAVQRLPPRDPDTLGFFTEAGAWRLQIEFPFTVPRLGQPLIASGINGQGNLLLLEVLEGRTIRFGYDQWGAGIAYSPALEIAGPGPHRLDVFIGAQVARQQFPAAWRIDSRDVQASARLLRVWLDGRSVWTTPILINADSYGLVSVGSNPQGFSTASAFYSGTLKRVALAPEELRRFLEENFRESRRPPP